MKNRTTDFTKTSAENTTPKVAAAPANSGGGYHASSLKPDNEVATKAVEKCPFRTLIGEWVACCQADGLSPKTTEDYADKAYKFWWWWDKFYAASLGLHPKNVGVKEARAFAAYLREPTTSRWDITNSKNNKSVTTLSQASISGYGRTIKVFFNWLEREDYIDQSPFNKSVKFTNRHKQDRVVKTVGVEELRQIFVALTEGNRLKTYDGCRNLAMVALLLDSGMRRGELLSLRLCDIDLERNRCVIKGKTGQRWALFSEACQPALADYLQKYRYPQEQAKNNSPLSLLVPLKESTAPLWLTEDSYPISYDGFGIMITRLAKRSGVRFHAHRLRHTYATSLARQGINVFDLKELMGHSSITTTQIYIQQNIERLDEVYRPRSPLVGLTGGTKLVPGLKRRQGRPRRMR